MKRSAYVLVFVIALATAYAISQTPTTTQPSQTTGSTTATTQTNSGANTTTSTTTSGTTTTTVPAAGTTTTTSPSVTSQGTAGASVSSGQGTSGTVTGTTGTEASTPATGSQEATTQSNTSNAAADAELKEQIQNAFRNEPSLRSATSLQVNVTGSTIEIVGMVPAAQDRVTARRLAASFGGNRRIVDRTTVLNSTGTATTDSDAVQDATVPSTGEAAGAAGNTPQEGGSVDAVRPQSPAQRGAALSGTEEKEGAGNTVPR